MDTHTDMRIDEPKDSFAVVKLFKLVRGETTTTIQVGCGVVMEDGSTFAIQRLPFQHTKITTANA